MSIDFQNQFAVTSQQDLHIERGRQMLRRYPELKALHGPYWPSALCIVLLVATQLVIVWYLIGKSRSETLLWAWLFGSCINLALFTLIHEVSHNLVFRHPVANYLIGFVANLPLVVPLSVNYRYYHLAHHRFMGYPDKDVDMPLASEARLVGHSFWRKLLWLIFFFWPYGVSRSLANKSVVKFDSIVACNIAVQLLFLYWLWTWSGTRGVFYLGAATIFSISLSPAFGARGLLEHYVVKAAVPTRQETFSYYGPYNLISFNNGYHFEHHDLMGIPWRRLPRIKQIAPEFYQDLYSHKSYFKLLWSFLFDRQESLYRRIERQRM